MSYGHNQTITATDFNTYLSEIVQNYSTGAGDRGYGQTILAVNPVHTSQETITANQWIKLAQMIGVCAQQTGTSLSGIKIDAATMSVISVGGDIQPALSTIDGNRLVPSSLARSTYPTVNTVTQTTAWNGLLDATFNLDFGSEDAARYFFNSGGEIHIKLFHPGTSNNLNNSWKTLLESTIKTIVLKAKSITIAGTGTPVEVATASGYYNFASLEQKMFKVNNAGTNYSSGATDNVTVFAKRGNSTGINGGNGSAISLRIECQCEGEASGTTITPGMNFVVDIVKADKFLSGIVTPNVSSSGFTLVRIGNRGASTPSDVQPPSTPGQAQYPAGSTRSFVVPQYSTITFDLKGAGGSEGSSLGPQPRPSSAKALFSPAGVAGGNATVAELNLIAYGGGGGGIYRYVQQLPGIPGTPGTALNGDTNQTGGGAAGGQNRYKDNLTWYNGAAGGAGGRCIRTYVRGSLGAPSVGQTLTVVTPDGGYSDSLTNPAGGDYDFYPGNPGSVGDVQITWTNTSAGSTAWHTPGTYSFSIPEYTTLKFTLSGGGGGQSGTGQTPVIGFGGFQQIIAAYPGQDGQAGGTATVTGITGWNPAAFGGNGGHQDWNGSGFVNARGDDGVRYDGDNPPGKGGGAGGGHDGSLHRFGVPNPYEGAPGGDGALVTKTFTRGAAGSPVPGQVVQCTVPAGGQAGHYFIAAGVLGDTWSDAGQDGWIQIDWT